jgi:histidinol-phosphate phosphatase family protein
MNIKAVILAGGKGTRLGGLAEQMPKPIVAVHDRPVLEYQLDSLRRSGITDIVLVLGHLGDRIESHLGDGSAFGVRISYLREEQPLGTAGALAAYRGELTPYAVVLYGDLVVDMDFAQLVSFHAARAALCTLVVHPNNHPYDSDLLVLDDRDRVTGMLSKHVPRTASHANRVNAGIYLLDHRALSGLTPGEPADLERDVVAPLIAAGAVQGYRTTEYIRDMGTPDRLRECGEDLARGVVAGRHRGRPQRAIFFDRDGTLNRYAGLLTCPEELEIPDAVPAGLRAVNRSGLLAIVVSNQPVVARNLCTEAQVDRIHDHLETLLGQQRAYLDAIFYCPHHPDGGYPEENPAYKIACSCRKPDTAMVDRAVTQFNIDKARSYLVGDTTVDVETGRRAGLRTVLVKTGLAGTDGKYPGVTADLEAEDLAGAVDLILAEQLGPRERTVT